MKKYILAFSLFAATGLMAQQSTLPSGNYRWSQIIQQQSGNRQATRLLKGSTLDNEELSIHTTTLLPNQKNHAPQASTNAEELIIIKEGQVEATVENETKTLGPGGLILLISGDKQSIKNSSNIPATYYVISFKSKDGLDIARAKSAGGSFMKDWSEFEVKQTALGQSRPIFDRPSGMFQRFDVHATALNPGVESHPPHTHRAEEIILMIKGTGEMQMGNSFHNAAAGDVLLVNAQVPHAFKNTGTEPCGYFAIQWHSNAELKEK